MLFVLGEIVADVLRDEIMLVRQAKLLARLVDKFRAASPCALDVPATSGMPFPIKVCAMIICGFPLSRSLRNIQRVEKCCMSWPSIFLHVKAVGLETLAGIFALRLRRHRVERDGVRVVDQDQVIESEVTGERARFRRDAFLQTTIARQADHVLIENPVLGRC